MLTKWVLIDETAGAKTQDGASLDAATLTRIAIACDSQLNKEFTAFYGGVYQVRAGASKTDIQPGEQVYAFVPALAQAPGASAYHDVEGNGVPVAYCAVETCGSLLGPTGVSVDASHELLEAAADPSCNLLADNQQGLLIAYEVCDPVEVQTYASEVDSGVQLSNFVLPSWFDPKAVAPFDFMSCAQIEGAVAPPGPLQIAPGNGGNYYITETSSENETDTFGIKGKQRKARRDTSSRFMRRLLERQVSRRGKLRVAGITAPTTGVSVTVPAVIAGPKKLQPSATPQKLSVSLRRAIKNQAVNVKEQPQVGGPRELSEAGKQAVERYLSRAEVRGSVSTEGIARRAQAGRQVDAQQAVLAGRKRIRSQS